ncbi:MAG: hypothetical protein ACD_44C00400G0002 [uncultured bacterium]|nr:MAG: hypothetical protein ACD_44C00400G0002 [uncultured bacterium]OGT16677.1 MAG: 16S rRNA (cytosine(1402)-N(4))-methyltransferase [Gammaproteobacteria bacterium RIFCSPHIGHO2_02_FULL_38_33]OGT23861.1 MAG: 16S rRNA (cytosine(1402)-N(4))-methyltransferase [Gammaproteobacteria bacterium RIFCSPHIGHO2_12_38_15]OGT69131.1 MAG: 16S rRNA (cytosine(1402)-N(4))-methyltransferase [Gammaproteobacteria bacterium RIFCSPLOWO2_02_FULL_38_11]OGT77727.1 MAG: 16S rRNA (cytosine(1402)-N(4))-methyltransferase [G
METLHKPVLLNEVLKNLLTQAEGIYLDLTFGRGGHSKAILEKLNKSGKLFAFDKDHEAVEMAVKELGYDKRFQIFHNTFSDLEKIISSLDLKGKITGILLDLGVSSPQLDNASRGFSFNKDGVLDMRMDQRQTLKANTWINTVSESILLDVLKKFGEERFAKRIAHHIVNARRKNPIHTTKELAKIVAEAHPAWEEGQHPATKTFQAIRIFINKELDELNTCLGQASNVLAPGGRLVVISFHSLEDRIVKRFISKNSVGEVLPKEIPLSHAPGFTPTLKKVGKLIRPNHMEVKMNPRSRSAVMRVAEKIR